MIDESLSAEDGSFRNVSDALGTQVTHLPDAASLKKAMAEFDRHRRLGTTRDFYRAYAAGRRPIRWYIVKAERDYPLKAVWAAAHRPPIATANFNTRDARALLADFEIDAVCRTEAEVRDYVEGQRHLREASLLHRSRALVDAAKKAHGYHCAACGFNADAFPGIAGRRAIEAHHIEPLSQREGKGRPTRIEELMILCANCHRLAHSATPPLTLNALRSLVRSAQGKGSKSVLTQASAAGVFSLPRA